jgi:serine phosphatase RsbU (regulator of sigma subunit)
LHPGDALLLMTDGVTEARDSDGQFLDADGVRAQLRAALRAPSTEAALSNLLDAVIGYIGRNKRDDIAMLLLRRNAGAIETPSRAMPLSREASVARS